MSLIVAIGAQNAFVLRQGILRHHVPIVVAVCAVSDIVLIFAGTAGVSTLLTHAPGMFDVLRYAGGAFLLCYGALAARRAVRGTAGLDTDERGPDRSAPAVVFTCLALTWLNPHTYLDTVVLLGTVGNQQGDPGRWVFALGAVVASLAWFLALGFGARLLRGVFARPVAWRVLDGGVAALMLALAAGLLLGA
nr:LysE/ArgO family amino acid transporter [Rhodococcus sp. HNM0569]